MPSSRRRLRPRRPLPSRHRSRGGTPPLQWDAAGNLHAVYVEEQGGEAAVWYRRLGASPAGPVRVSPPGAKVNTNGNAPPILAILRDGLLVAAYPVTLPGHWKSEVRVQRSTDRGATWSESRLPHPQRVGTHSFLSAAVTPAGLLTLAWLDDSSGHMGLPGGHDLGRPHLLAPPDRRRQHLRVLRHGSPRRPERRGVARLPRPFRGGGGGRARFPGLEVDGAAALRCRHEAFERQLASQRLPGHRRPPGRGGRRQALGRLVHRRRPDRDLRHLVARRDGGARFAPRTLLTPAKGLYRHPEIGLLQGNQAAVVYEGVDTGGAFPGHPLLARLRDPRTGAWSAARRVAPQGAFPRLAVSAKPGESAALAFTCRAGQQTRVVIADWRLLGDGALPWAGCDLR